MEAIEGGTAVAGEEGTLAAEPPSDPRPASSGDAAIGPEKPAAGKPGRRGVRRAFLPAVVSALLLLSAAAVYYRSIRQPPPQAEAERPAAVVLSASPAVDLQGRSSEREIPDAVFGLESRLRQIDALRFHLEAKRLELERLQADYAYGALELEEELLPLLREEGGTALERRLRERSIELLLLDIQRRLAYRDSLSGALAAVEQAAGELLLVKRRALLERSLEDLFAGIDLRARFPEIDRLLEATEQLLARPPADEPLRRMPPLEPIRKSLGEKAKSADLPPERRRDLSIAAEICAGDLARAGELSTLTLRAARCLAESGALDLFLPGVRRMPPEAAAKLAEWPGDWLCLNGLRTLSPQIAQALAGWKGRRLSLNGLVDLREDAARELISWPGEELELMGLRSAASLELLASWEGRGKTLHVPAAIRAALQPVGQPMGLGNKTGTPAGG
ncbi:MAG: hypothetical protein WHT06_10675 [Desulfobacterales bacterium]